MTPDAPRPALQSAADAKATLLAWAEETDAATAARRSGPLPLIAGLVGGMVAGAVASKALGSRSSHNGSAHGRASPKTVVSTMWPLMSRAAIWAAPHIIRRVMAARAARHADAPRR